MSVREIYEELGLQVRPGLVLDAWAYPVVEGVTVLVVTHGCHAEPFAAVTPSREHRAAGLFTPGEVAALAMPDGYKKSIRAWRTLSRGSARPRSTDRRGGRRPR